MTKTIMPHDQGTGKPLLAETQPLKRTSRTSFAHPISFNSGGDTWA